MSVIGAMFRKVITFGFKILGGDLIIYNDEKNMTKIVENGRDFILYDKYR